MAAMKVQSEPTGDWGGEVTGVSDARPEPPARPLPFFFLDKGGRRMWEMNSEEFPAQRQMLCRKVNRAHCPFEGRHLLQEGFP